MSAATVASFASVTAEYLAAKTARDEAEIRLRAAADAYLAAQCQTLISITPSERAGYNTHSYCTREKGHDGDHQNITRS